MVRLNVRFNHDEYSDAQLSRSVGSILSESDLCAMSTVKGKQSHIHTAYFVCDEFLQVYFLSQPMDIHSQNIEKNPSIAVAIWSPCEEWGEHLRGLQIFGICERLAFLQEESITAMKLFVQRFPTFKSIVKHPGEFIRGVTSKIYVVRCQWLKLIDEPTFGRRNYITLSIARYE